MLINYYQGVSLLRTRRLLILLTLAIVLAVSLPSTAQEQFTGYLDDNNPRESYPIPLDAGQSLRIKTEATSGDLDTIVRVDGPDGRIVAENDNVDGTTTNSVLETSVNTAGTYQIIVASQPGTAGDFVMTVFVTDTPAAHADDTGIYEGRITRDGSEDTFPVTLAAGEGLYVLAEGRELDTYLLVEDTTGAIVAENDDRRHDNFDSELAYISEAGGTYTVIVTNYPGSTGAYTLEIITAPPADLPLILRSEFSGVPQYLDTEHFRIHYTFQGSDAITQDYLRELAAIVEEVWEIQIEQMGWPAPPRDILAGGDDRYDVYVLDLINEDLGGDYGMAVVEPPIYDDLSTAIVESSSASYILVDNDYQYFTIDPDRLLRATVAHEFHHMIQFGLDANETHTWYLEATATWMETQTYPNAQDATGYVEDTFTYPEVCLGAEGDADPTGGILMYGHWLFMQSLTDAHGAQIVPDLWARITEFQGWEPLERVLADYDDTLTNAVARYHLQNLVRDYTLAAEFDGHVVWKEDTITATGTWLPGGDGVQNLGANYYAVELADGTYTASVNESAPVELWVTAINDEAAQMLNLGDAGAFTTTGFDHVYLMVFNPAYDDDLTQCDYTDYSIEITLTDATPAPAVLKFDASQFKPLD